MKKVKILAPAGGREQLEAAVRSGANAVYLGARGFNARRNAENFSESSLPEAVAYCHERGVEVYVTLNTLVMDGELPALIEELDYIASAGADALIVQDLGVARIARSRYPMLPLFASTQTSVHNSEGVKLLASLGFSQAVLAREISAEELRDIAKSSPINLEYFVHGALCMSVSGSCYLSSMIGGRSGNRGLCAQPCRLDFRLGAKEHALSLKDMSLIPKMGELASIGIDALKIEGRMKRPEYVAAAVTACRDALDGKKPDMEALSAVFSRSGFTDGYFTGRRTADMFGYRTKENVEAASSVLPQLAKLYSNERPLVPVDVEFRAMEGEPATLTVSDGERAVSVPGPAPEKARTVALSQEVVHKPLSQMGGTPYFVQNEKYDIGENLSLPLPAIKGMRREALALLKKERTARPAYECTGAGPRNLPSHSAKAAPGIRLRFQSADQIFPAPGAEKIILPLELIEKSPELIEGFGERLICEPPSLAFPSDMPRLRSRLERVRGMGVSDIMADNLGIVQLAKGLGFSIHGDASLNILNSQTLDVFRELGLSDATVSFELAMNKIRKLAGGLPRGIIGYGYLTLMKLRACPARGSDGCGSCAGKSVLVDEKNERFPLACRERLYTELFNCVPLYIGDKPYGDIDFITLRFTTETASEAQSVYNAFINKEAPAFKRTGGLYYRELL